MRPNISVQQRLMRLAMVRAATMTHRHSSWYRRMCAAALLAVLLLAGVPVSWHLSHTTASPLVVAVADLSGGDSRSDTTALVAQQLRRALVWQRNVQVITLDHPIKGGREDVQVEGRSHGAALIVWARAPEVAASSLKVALTTPPRLLADAPLWLTGIEQPLALIEGEPLGVDAAQAPLVVAALAHYAAGDWQGAAQAFRGLLEQASAPQGAAPQVELYLWRSLAALRSGTVLRAGKAAAVAQRQEPTKGQPYLLSGIIAALGGDHQRAVTAYTDAAKRGLGVAPVYWARGLSRDIAGDRGGALDDFDVALRLDPHFAQAYTSRGMILSYMGEFNAAINDFTQALRLNPADLDARDLRADSYREIGQYDLALADYNLVIAQKPTYPETYAMRGNAYARKGEQTRAVADVDRLIDLQAQAFLRQGLREAFSLRFAYARNSYNQYRRWSDDAQVRAELLKAWGIASPSSRP
jgi:tetratricopeptide (TPR) repeat protein